MLLFNFISIIKLFLFQYSGFAFFSDSPPHPTKWGTSRYVALSCLSSVKERPSRKTFHVSQASGLPWTERCLVPEGASCARDDLLWAKECAVTHRFRQRPMHITHMVDICTCSTPSSQLIGINDLERWRNICSGLSGLLILGIQRKSLVLAMVLPLSYENICSKGMKNRSRSYSNKKKTGSTPHLYRQVSQLLREHSFAQKRG